MFFVFFLFYILFIVWIPANFSDAIVFRVLIVVLRHLTECEPEPLLLKRDDWLLFSFERPFFVAFSFLDDEYTFGEKRHNKLFRIVVEYAHISRVCTHTRARVEYVGALYEDDKKTTTGKKFFYSRNEI